MKTRKSNAKINNHRLAVTAITGISFQDGLAGRAWCDWASYTGSLMRTLEDELGVQGVQALPVLR